MQVRDKDAQYKPYGRDNGSQCSHELATITTYKDTCDWAWNSKRVYLITCVATSACVENLIMKDEGGLD